VHVRYLSNIGRLAMPVSAARRAASGIRILSRAHGNGRAVFYRECAHFIPRTVSIPFVDKPALCNPVRGSCFFCPAADARVIGCVRHPLAQAAPRDEMLDPPLRVHACDR
jgi:hypothetical protein